MAWTNHTCRIGGEGINVVCNLLTWLQRSRRSGLSCVFARRRLRRQCCKGQNIEKRSEMHVDYGFFSKKRIPTVSGSLNYVGILLVK